MAFRCKHEWSDSWDSERHEYSGRIQHCIVCGHETTAARIAGAAKAAATRRAPERNADGFTAKQVARADRLVTYWLNRYCGSSKEVKQQERRALDYGGMALLVVIGMVGDEGTAAALVCRDRYHVFISAEGGVSCFASHKTKRGNWTTRLLTGRRAIDYYEH